jgi:multidrug efflux pump subunit AcrB
VVVFVPLAFLDGLPGAFFRSLALTMVVALLASLVLAVTLTPALASLFLRDRAHLEHGHAPKSQEGGFIMRPLLRVFDVAMRRALRWRWVTLLACILIGFGGWKIYERLPTGFMPDMDEGGFVIDCLTPWGTSLEETDRMMQQAEEILRATPEVEGYSRRTGARLALAIAEPNKGDILVKLRPDRERSTEDQRRAARNRVGNPRHPRRSTRRPDRGARSDRDQTVFQRHRVADEEGAGGKGGNREGERRGRSQ